MSWIDEQIAICEGESTPRNWPDTFEFRKCLEALKAAREALVSCINDNYEMEFDEDKVNTAIDKLDALGK